MCDTLVVVQGHITRMSSFDRCAVARIVRGATRKARQEENSRGAAEVVVASGSVLRPPSSRDASKKYVGFTIDDSSWSRVFDGGPYASTLDVCAASLLHNGAIEHDIASKQQPEGH